MSSIYKKGRDGYFYYQTYTLNKETGKKDKKIFHSLGTKDIKIAEEKKILLDKKYDQKNNKINYKKLFFYPIILIIVIIIFFNSYQNALLKEKLNQDTIDTLSSGQIGEKINSPKINKTISLPITENTNPDKNFGNDSLISLKNDTNHIFGKQKMNVVPSHNVIKVERLPNSFNQIKIYATIDTIVTSKSMLRLCEKLKEDNLEFSSIIICLYANTKDGIEMAQNYDAKISKHIKQKNWLAMYTFNPVEGEYFDDNPGQYLGLY
tara:strand:+ start:527 stop:1318 length:792 start_codon:yes stop_codon:yes gene_type:complete